LSKVVVDPCITIQRYRDVVKYLQPIRREPVAETNRTPAAPERAAAPDDRALEEIARHFRALSEPLRLKLLSRLRESECNVGELTEQLGCSQANVSKHLSTLQAAGIVERRTVGTASYYRIADPATLALCELVCDHVARRLGDHSAVGRSVRDWAAENHGEPGGRAGGARRGTRGARVRGG
jgi:DNA-binding transcriptional ArsR family regulator